MMAGPRITRQITIVLTFFLSVWLRCPSTPSEPEFDNPLIPGDPSFEPPRVSLVSGPAEGAVLYTCHVELVWRGNQPDMEFSYQLDNSEWSDWSADTALTCPWLEEGPHDFQVKGRYANGIESDEATAVSFEVDDIQGPALRLCPRYQEVVTASTFSVEVMLEEVTNVFAVKVVLEFDSAKLQVTQIEVYEDARSLLKVNGGTVIPFSRYDNAAGTLTIEVATATGDPPGVGGTGVIAEITFSAIQAGEGVIAFDAESEIRNPDNVEISLAESVQAVVEVR